MTTDCQVDNLLSSWQAIVMIFFLLAIASKRIATVLRDRRASRSLGAD
jgi:hypothetical protein